MENYVVLYYSGGVVFIHKKMTKNKDKQIRELKIDRIVLFWIGFLVGVFLLQMAFLIVGITGKNINDLEQQLQSCQEKVPVYIFNEKKVGNTISFWSNYTGEFVNYTGEFVNYIEIGVISYYRDRVEVWNMPKEEMQLRKEVWCKVNEIENCGVIE